MQRKIWLTAWLSLCLAAPVSAQLSDDKDYAPAPMEVDGILAVPIDVQHLNASVVFDVDAKTVRVEAEMVFEMTGKGGNPIFDLRQEIRSAELNGESIEPGKMAPHSFGDSAGTLRVIEKELEAGKLHALHLSYEWGTPKANQARPIEWGQTGVKWDTYLSDLNPGRYLEMWFPANLIYDRFGFELVLEIANAKADHHLLTNGELEELGRHKWRLRFPAHFSSFSPLIHIVPAEQAERSESRVKLKDGTILIVDILKELDAAGNIAAIQKQVARDFEEFSEAFGAWTHGERFSIYVWKSRRAMEYDGATSTNIGALRHEFFHSWFGRGLKPASQNDGWVDEAWDVYAADMPKGATPNTPENAPPVVLCSEDPWNRSTPGASYRAGSLFFARLAKLMGDDVLRGHMADFYKKRAGDVFTTAQLEQHLYCASKMPEVRQLFHRYVYGKEGEAPEVPEGYCK